jgi:valyl-tRNA synthetase
VWEWKAESGGTIVNQLRRLGASCDWSRERFTMDEGLSRAVLKVFVALYREGLIYKDKRLVNWDPKLLTAISDLEVVQVETKGHLWHLRYPIEGKTFDPNDPSTFIVVATTRPETMLGDTAVAVHPDDERFKNLVGKNVILPLVGRRIPIIADEYSDPEKGSGAVKITPAHDFNDFEVGKRHGLPMINVLDTAAKISVENDIPFWENTTYADRHGGAEEVATLIGGFQGDEGEYVRYKIDDTQLNLLRCLGGLDRFVARKKIVEILEADGYLAKVENHNHVVPHGDRSNVVIEPFLTDQWYVNAKELAKPAIAAVREGKTNFVPKNWKKTYFDWMENIQPWCISRQLWWGHQIPAWYGPDDGVFCALTEEEAKAAAEKHYGRAVEVVEKSAFTTRVILESTWLENNKTRFDATPVPLHRDEDVLDTWFSSALWPFSTLGWPDETSELKRFYPTSALVTGFDIIFFWVARMMMMGLHFMPDVPFADVYIHRLVRDEKGAKMSKSKGNVVDPLGIIDEYGADALRFTLARNVASGHDIRLGPQDVENNRNFATKLWNAARFAEMNGCATAAAFDPNSVKETINQWIVTQFSDTLAQVELALSDYRFNDAANRIYQFVWNFYCDWYLEFTKPILLGGDSATKRETQATTAYVRDEILKLLHPFMPFITEELWQVTATAPRQSLLALTEWPGEGPVFAEANEEVAWVIELITAIRSVRAEMNITAAIPLVLAGASAGTQARAERWAEFIKRLARVSVISSAASAPQGSVQLVVRGEVAALPLIGVIDLAAERARLAKEMQKAYADIARVDGKLGNANFVARAPEEVVEEEKEKREEALGRKAKIAEALVRLKGAT